jgi:hypothetical protein
MDVTATAYDEEGNILGTSEGYTQLLLPQHKVAFCEQFGDYVPASIEVEVDPMDDGEFAVWDLETDGNPTFEVANLNEVTDEYSTTINGTVHNDYTQKTYIEVVVVMRDADGNLVAGANGYVDDATAKDDTVFSAQMYDIAPEHASLEGYANADVPN